MNHPRSDVMRSSERDSMYATKDSAYLLTFSAWRNTYRLNIDIPKSSAITYSFPAPLLIRSGPTTLRTTKTTEVSTIPISARVSSNPYHGMETNRGVYV